MQFTTEEEEHLNEIIIMNGFIEDITKKRKREYDPLLDNDVGMINNEYESIKNKIVVEFQSLEEFITKIKSGSALSFYSNNGSIPDDLSYYPSITLIVKRKNSIEDGNKRVHIEETIDIETLSDLNQVKNIIHHLNYLIYNLVVILSEDSSKQVNIGMSTEMRSLLYLDQVNKFTTTLTNTKARAFNIEKIQMIETILKNLSRSSIKDFNQSQTILQYIYSIVKRIQTTNQISFSTLIELITLPLSHFAGIKPLLSNIEETSLYTIQNETPIPNWSQIKYLPRNSIFVYECLQLFQDAYEVYSQFNTSISSFYTFLVSHNVLDEVYRDSVRVLIQKIFNGISASESRVLIADLKIRLTALVRWQYIIRTVSMRLLYGSVLEELKTKTSDQIKSLLLSKLQEERQKGPIVEKKFEGSLIYRLYTYSTKDVIDLIQTNLIDSITKLILQEKDFNVFDLPEMDYYTNILIAESIVSDTRFHASKFTNAFGFGKTKNYTPHPIQYLLLEMNKKRLEKDIQALQATQYNDVLKNIYADPEVRLTKLFNDQYKTPLFIILNNIKRTVIELEEDSSFQEEITPETVIREGGRVLSKYTNEVNITITHFSMIRHLITTDNKDVNVINSTLFMGLFYPNIYKEIIGTDYMGAI